MMKRFVLLLMMLALTGPGFLGAEEIDEPGEVRPGFFGRILDTFRGSPSRIERVGEVRLDDLELKMSLTPDEVSLAEHRRINVEVALKNKGRRMARLTFPTGQRVELVLRDADGTLLYQWSEDQLFTQQTGYLVLNPGERVVYELLLPTRHMRAGETYEVEAFLPVHEAVQTKIDLAPGE